MNATYDINGIRIRPVSELLIEKLEEGMRKKADPAGYSSFSVFGAEQAGDAIEGGTAYNMRYEDRDTAHGGGAQANASVSYMEQQLRIIAHFFEKGDERVEQARQEMMRAIKDNMYSIKAADYEVTKIFRRYRNIALGI